MTCGSKTIIVIAIYICGDNAILKVEKPNEPPPARPFLKTKKPLTIIGLCMSNQSNNRTASINSMEYHRVNRNNQIH
jgi:hypothetical protein